MSAVHEYFYEAASEEPDPWKLPSSLQQQRAATTPDLVACNSVVDLFQNFIAGNSVVDKVSLAFDKCDHYLCEIEDKIRDRCGLPPLEVDEYSNAENDLTIDDGFMFMEEGRAPNDFHEETAQW